MPQGSSHAIGDGCRTLTACLSTRVPKARTDSQDSVRSRCTDCHGPTHAKRHVSFDSAVEFWFPAWFQIQRAHTGQEGSRHSQCPVLNEQRCFFGDQLGRKAKAQPLRLGSTPYGHVAGGQQRLTPAPQLRVQTASQPGASVTGAASSSPQRRPFTSFDEVLGIRDLQGERDWDKRAFVIHAINTARLPGCPEGKFLSHHVAGFPRPHIALTQSRRYDRRNTIVFDCRSVGGEVEAVDIHPHKNLHEAILDLRRYADPQSLARSLIAGQVTCRVNEQDASIYAPVGLDVEVVVFSRADSSRSVYEDGEGSPVAGSVGTTLPFSVRTRPPTPPIPADNTLQQPTSGPAVIRRRWQRSTGLAASVGPRVVSTAADVPDLPWCSIFDPLRQHELAQTVACENAGGLLVFAMAKARHLGDAVDGRVIQFELNSFAKPQVVIFAPVRADFVVLPVEVAPGMACTVVINRDASGLELMLRLEEQCGLPSFHRKLAARGLTHVFVNNERVEDFFARDALLVADTAYLVHAVVMIAHSVADSIEPITPHPQSCNGFFCVHRPGTPPVEVHFPERFSASEVRRALINVGLLDSAGHLLRPEISPAIPGGSAHFVALTRQQTEAETDYMLVDLRRVAHPPLVTHWVTRLCAQADSAHLFEILHEEFHSFLRLQPF